MPEVEGQAMPVDDPAVYTPDDGGWWSGLTDTVESAAHAASRAAEIAQQKTAASNHASGAGFSFDHDQLVSIAGKWKELADGFDDDAQTARELQRAQPPGHEYASINNVSTIHESGQTMAEGLEKRAEYCKAQHKKFLTAAGEYERADEEAKTAVRAQDDGSM